MEFWTENKTKILGTATALVAAVLSMIALGMFDATEADPVPLMSPHSLRWVTILLSLANVALGGGTVAVGVQNTTKERVAQAAIDVAQAQAVTATQVANAINTPPPPIPVPIVVAVATADPTTKPGG